MTLRSLGLIMTGIAIWIGGAVAVEPMEKADSTGIAQASPRSSRKSWGAAT